MKISPCFLNVSYGAKLDQNTRILIRTLDREYKQSLEYQIDKAIDESPLKGFADDRATISFVETENPHSNIAPVVSMNINGIVATHVLKGFHPVCEEQDEELLLEKMQRRPYRYMNIITNRLNSASLAQIQKGLVLDYFKQKDAASSVEKSEKVSFDELIKSC